MNKFWSNFILNKEKRREVRRRLQLEERSFRLANGDLIPPPIYGKHELPSSVEPAIFNREGERIRSVFLRDRNLCHEPAYTGRGHIYFDRYNWGLKNHFYTHRCMLDKVGHPEKRYGMLIETRGVAPAAYDLLEANVTLREEFDAIFTYNAAILEHCSNAKFVPFCSWVRLDFRDFESRGQGLMSDELWQSKSKDVSILSSDKKMCDLHRLRIDTAKRLAREGLADPYGTFLAPTKYVRAYDTLADYRYSVVFENEISPYCFTEKLTNCFACQTIPIYIGATHIQEFFNAGGIIRVSPDEVSRLPEIIRAKATPEFYEERLEAIKDNYRRVRAEYLDAYEYMYQKHLAKGGLA